jgi:hypothetical protein
LIAELFAYVALSCTVPLVPYPPTEKLTLPLVELLAPSATDAGDAVQLTAVPEQIALRLKVPVAPPVFVIENE